jgi:hypothetical protein
MTGRTSSFSRSAPRLIQSAKIVENTDTINVLTTARRSQIPEEHSASMTPWTLRSKLNPSSKLKSTSHVPSIQLVSLGTNQPVFRMSTKDSATEATSLKNPISAQPQLSESFVATPLVVSTMAPEDDQDLSYNATYLRSSQPRAADQSLLAEIGLSIPISGASQKVQSSVSKTPRSSVAASKPPFKDNTSAVPTRFSYKKPDIVKDPKGRR